MNRMMNGSARAAAASAPPSRAAQGGLHCRLPSWRSRGLGAAVWMAAVLRHPTRVAPTVAALFVFTACGALAGAGERPPAAPDLSSSNDWSRKDRSKPRGAPSNTQLAASPDTPTVPPGGWPAKVTPPAGWPKRWSHPFQHVPTALPNPTTKVFDDVLPAGLIAKLHTEALLGLGRIFALCCYSPALSLYTRSTYMYSVRLFLNR